MLSVLLVTVVTASAQTQFLVPAPTLQQKYDRSMSLVYNNILGLITIAKRDGMTADEHGKKSSAVDILNWDEKTTFEQFVNICHVLRSSH